MAETKFRYNPKTLRYERVIPSIVSIAFKGFGYLVFGCAFFVGLVMLQNLVIETPLEKSLRAENEALQLHKNVLVASLQESNRGIQDLRKEDQQLYERLFETKVVSENETDVYKKDEILTAEPTLFAEWEKSVRSNFNSVFKKAQLRDNSWAQQIHIDKTKLSKLKHLPSISPIADIEADKLVSGFGKRINPFHKGIYHHDGIDFAMPAGTPVVATAPGTVIRANTSNQVAGFGNYVEIDHGNGIVTRYAHLADLNVRYGQSVAKGQKIGTVGSSGGSIAPHLHYEVIRGGTNVNPVHYLVGNYTSTFYIGLVLASEKGNQSLD
jgi:murein DD-endopeptidase MepM/ murein hydrolase activator NlpD